MEFTKDINFSNALKAKETSKITYSGELFQKQSGSLTIVYGFGQNWDYTTEQEMFKGEQGFSVEVEMKEGFDTFNFCFRNENNEWDNNGYANYISSIEAATVVEQEDLDSALLMEILDSLLKEYQEPQDNKQQILDDILSESEDDFKTVNLISDFDMDGLIETILNPVINFETQEDDFESIVNFEAFDQSFIDELRDSLEKSVLEISEVKTQPVLAKEKSESEGGETALVPTESGFLVSPRKLRKFYLVVKKIKLAFYKLFVSIPKLLYGSFEENKD